MQREAMTCHSDMAAVRQAQRWEKWLSSNGERSSSERSVKEEVGVSATSSSGRDALPRLGKVREVSECTKITKGALAATGECDVWTLLERGVAQRNDTWAIKDTVSAFTYAETRDRSAALGAWLLSLDDNVIAVLAVNCVFVIEMHYAAAAARKILLNLNTRLTADEIAYQLRQAESRTILAAMPSKSLIEEAVGLNDEISTLLWIHSDSKNDYEEIISRHAVLQPTKFESGDDKTGLEMYFTSGTTGQPKAVLLSHRIVYLHALQCCLEHRLNRNDIWLHTAPMFHLVDAYAIFAITWAGGRHIIPAAAFRVEDLIEGHGATVTNIATTMVTMALCDPRFLDAFEKTSFTLLSCGGAPLPRSHALRLLNIFKGEFFQSYGMTECCGKIATSIVDPETRSHLSDATIINELVCSSGKPFGLLSVRLSDSGEVLVTGPTVFEGYHKIRDNDSFAFDDHGRRWFRTGDLATMNEHGYLTITDRAKDMILVGSENVYCAEVERVLYSHPEVALAAVYGLTDAALGERVKACIVLKSRGTTVTEIQRFCALHLADFKVPSVVVFLDELPLTGTGKISKLELRKRDLEHQQQKDFDEEPPLYAIDWQPAPPLERADISNIDEWLLVASPKSHELAAHITSELGPNVKVLDTGEAESAKANQAVVALFLYEHSESCLELSSKCLSVARMAKKASRLVIVTVGVSTNTAKPQYGAVWGFFRAAATELLETQVSLLDLCPNLLDNTEASAMTIASECLCKQRCSNEIAYWGQCRLCPRLKYLERPPRNRLSGGTHIITGASGGLGNALVERLEQQGVDRIVLVSRSSKARSNEKRIVVQADVTKVEDMTRIRDAAGPKVTCIWHLAGIVDSLSLDELTMDSMAQVLGPKVEGSLNLLQAFGAQTKIIFFTSVYGLLGSPRLAPYAMANAFQDFLARQRENCLAVSWGVWDEAGMAHRFGAGFRAQVLASGTRFISLQDGFNLVLNHLSSAIESNIGGGHLAALPIDWNMYLAKRVAARLKHQPLCGYGEGLDVQDTSAIVNTKPIQDKAIATRVRDVLIEVVHHLDIEALEDTAPLATLGVSSLHAVALASRLSETFNLELAPTLVFEAITLRGIIEHVGGKLGVSVSGMVSPATHSIISKENGKDDSILVVGSACRTPGGADDTQSLWNLLELSVNAVKCPPCGRPPKRGRPAGYLSTKTITSFDQVAFSYSASEAAAMDPQQRLALTCGAEALQQLLTRRDLQTERPEIATYVGATQVDYASLLSIAPKTAYEATGVATIAAIANRLNYVFNLAGPSVAIDTACSSSLVALDLAVKHVKASGIGALAGGVNVQLVHRWSDAFVRAGMLSPRNRCAFGDDSADGYVRGEACAFVALASSANLEKHHVAVQTTVVNQDGRSNGLTAPNPKAQATMLRRAVDHCDGTIPGYVEAHGTGTRLGDPIELQALSRVYGKLQSTPLLTASVKSNLGHSECAATASSLIKLLGLCNTAHRQPSVHIPASLHVKQLNRVLDWSSLGVRVVATPSPCPSTTLSDMGVSGFGFAGTNAHAVFRRMEYLDHDKGENVVAPFILESHSLDALRLTADRWLRQVPQGRSLCDVVRSARASFAARRALFPDQRQLIRAAVLPTSLDDVQVALESLAMGHEGNGLGIMEPADENSRSEHRVCFVFTGQGATYGGMGRALAKYEPSFYNALEKLSKVADNILDSMQVSEILLRMDRATAEAELLASSKVSQVAQLCFQCALFDALLGIGGEHFDFSHAAFLGHSLGEIAAFVCSGVLDFEEAIRFAAGRGAAVDDLSSSSMIAVSLASSEVTKLLAETPIACVAVENSPKACVVAVIDASKVEDVKALIRRQHENVVMTELSVPAGYHSAAIDAALPAIGVAARAFSTQRQSTSRIIVSTLTGQHWQAERDSLVEAGRWQRHARSPVLFASAIREVLDDSIDLFIEMGPRPQLTRHIEHIAQTEGYTVKTMHTCSTRGDDSTALRSVLATMAAGNLHTIPASEGQASSFIPPANAYSEESQAWILSSVDAAEVNNSSIDAEDGALETHLTYSMEWESISVANVDKTISDRRRILLIPDISGETERIVRSVFQSDHVSICNKADDVETVSLDVDFIVVGSGLDRMENEDKLAKVSESHLYTFITLLKRIASEELDQELVVLVLTRNVFPDKKLELSAVVGATYWGACETARLELTAMRKTRIVCVDIVNNTSDMNVSIQALAPLLMCDEEALRLVDGSKLQVQRISRIGQVPHAGFCNTYKPPASGIVLITGGTGALGALFAKWLIDRRRAHNGELELVLLSRSGRISEDVPMLANEIVKVITCDVSDADAVAAVCDTYRGRIVGVVHTAGILQDASLLKIQRSQIRNVFSPKVGGAFNLVRALVGENKLEFFWLFSSVTALMGNPGQIVYGAANAVLDCLARQISSLRLPALSIQWGPWAERGMAAAMRERLETASPWSPISDDDALSAFCMLLSSQHGAQSVTCVARFNAPILRRTASTTPHRRRVFERLISTTDRISEIKIPTKSRAILGADYVETTVREALARFIGLNASKVNRSTSLQELGLDSLDSAEVATIIAERLAVVVPPTLLLEVDSIHELIERVQSESALVPSMQAPQTYESVDDKLRSILIAHGTPSTKVLSQRTMLSSLGLDSMDSAGVAAAVSDAFGIQTSPMLLLELETFGDLCESCERCGSTHRSQAITPLPATNLCEFDDSQAILLTKALSTIEDLRLPPAFALILWGIVKLYWWAIRVVLVLGISLTALKDTIPSLDIDVFIKIKTVAFFHQAPFLALAAALLPFYFTITNLVFALTCKWLLVGRFREVESASRWSWYALRCDLVGDVLRATEAYFWLLRDGSPLFVLWYSLLGAKIGKGVSLCAGACTTPDLCVIGDNVVFERGAMLIPSRVDPGGKCFGARKCIVGASSRISIDAVIVGGCIVGRNAFIKHSSVGQGIIPPWSVVNSTKISTRSSMGESVHCTYYSTSPLPNRESGQVDYVCMPANEIFALRDSAIDLLDAFGICACGLAPAVVVAVTLFSLSGSIILAYISFGLYLCAYTAVAKYIVIGRFTSADGVDEETAYEEEASTLRRARALAHVDRVGLLAANTFIDALFRSTVVQNLWLQLLGSKVHLGADVACMRDFRASTAHLISIGDGAFLAGSPRFCNSELIHRDSKMILRHSRIKIGDGAFVGFGAAVLPGTTIEANSAVADYALVGARRLIKSGTTIVGIADFSERIMALRRNGEVSSNGDVMHSYRSRELSLFKYQCILICMLFYAVALEYHSICSSVLLVKAAVRALPCPLLIAIIITLPPVRLLVGVSFALIAIAHKHLILGKIKPLGGTNGIHTTWKARSVGIASWLVQFRLNLAADAWLEHVAYTEIFSIIWRAMGADVGKSARLGRIGPPDHDALRVGDRCYIEITGALYSHDFVNGNLVFKANVMGNDVSILGPSAILPGTILDDDVVIGPGSMTLAGKYSKSQSISTEKKFGLYRGNPARICTIHEDRADADWCHPNDGVQSTAGSMLDYAFDLMLQNNEMPADKAIVHKHVGSESHTTRRRRRGKKNASSKALDVADVCSKYINSVSQIEPRKVIAAASIAVLAFVASSRNDVAVAGLASGLALPVVLGRFSEWQRRRSAFLKRKRKAQHKKIGTLSSTSNGTANVVESAMNVENYLRKSYGFGGVLTAFLHGDDLDKMKQSVDKWRARALVDATLMYRAVDTLNSLSSCDQGIATAVTFSNRLELLERLDAVDKALDAFNSEGESKSRIRGVVGPSIFNVSQKERIVFMYGGESCYDGVAQELWQHCTEFQSAIRLAALELTAAGLNDVLPRILDGEVFLSQVSIRERNACAFAIQFALTATVSKVWQIKPVAVVGYSIGELAAAVVVGMLNLRDVCRLFAATTYSNFEREGAMAVCSSSSRIALEALIDSIHKTDSSLVIAAEYSSHTFMIAGSIAGVKAIAGGMDAGTCTILKEVTNAYHSPLHSVKTDEAISMLMKPSEPKISFFSCANGGLLQNSKWPETLTNLGALYDAPVLFKSTIEDVIDQVHPTVLLDLSLKGDLAYYFSAWVSSQGNDSAHGRTPPRAIATLRLGSDACERMVLAAADLALHDLSIISPRGLGLFSTPTHIKKKV